MNFFLVHLSLADILTVLFSLIPEIAWTFTNPFFHGGDFLCRSVKFLQVTCLWNIPFLFQDKIFMSFFWFSIVKTFIKSTYFALSDAWTLSQLFSSLCNIYWSLQSHLPSFPTQGDGCKSLFKNLDIVCHWKLSETC